MTPETPSPSEVREAQISAIIAKLYVMTGANFDVGTDRDAVRDAVALAEADFEDRIQQLHDSRVIATASAREIALTASGIERIEERLRDLCARVGVAGVMGSSLSELCQLWGARTWERHVVMRAVYRLAEGRTSAWVSPLEKIRTESGLAAGPFETALWYLEGIGYLELPVVQTVKLTDNGREWFEGILDIIESAESAVKDGATLVEALTGLGRRESVKSEADKGLGEAPEDKLERAYFQDEDGVWLTVPILRDRFGIPKSRLKDWRDSGCPDLGGRRLKARQEHGVGWVYFRSDVHEIASRRDDREAGHEKLARLDEIVRQRRDLIGG